VKIPQRLPLLRQMVQSRIRQLVARGPVLSASLVQISKVCGRPGCRCQSGHKHIGHYLTLKVAGKTRTVYVPQELLPEVQAWIKEHKRLKQLVAEISQLSLARVRGHVRDRQRRQGRP